MLNLSAFDNGNNSSPSMQRLIFKATERNEIEHHRHACHGMKKSITSAWKRSEPILCIQRERAE
jgi:hypothetical protein